MGCSISIANTTREVDCSCKNPVFSTVGTHEIGEPVSPQTARSNEFEKILLHFCNFEALFLLSHGLHNIWH